MNSIRFTSLILFFTAFLGCNFSERNSAQKKNTDTTEISATEETIKKPLSITPYDSSTSTIHILVALCDNFYQGIVPVPEGIGNGQNARTNLYWGCGYGVKTYFKRSLSWEFLHSREIDSLILERAIFRHKSSGVYLVADAYNGKFIKNCTHDFLMSSSGQKKDTVHYQDVNLGTAGNAKLIAYIGHNGLMDFDVLGDFTCVDERKRDVMMLACSSRYYFEQKFDLKYVNPIVWTKSLMAPEAYTIHDAIEAYINEKPDSLILDAAISAYAKYQKCGKKGATTILVSGY